MSTRVGSLITAPIRIQDDNIQNPVAFQEEIQGGAHSNDTLAKRDALEKWHRAWGMSFRVYNDGVNNGNYILTYGHVDTDITNNANWVLETVGGTVTLNLLKGDVTVNGAGTFTLPANAMLYSVMVAPTGPISAFKVGTAVGLDDLVMTQPIPNGPPQNFHKGIFYPSPQIIYFGGVSPQSVCSVVYFTF